MLEFSSYSAQTLTLKFWSRADKTVQVGTVAGYTATESNILTLYSLDPDISEIPAGDYYVEVINSGVTFGNFVARRVSSTEWITGDMFETISDVTYSVNVLPFSHDTESRVQEQVINVFYMEDIPVVVYVNDSTGVLDLTSKTLKFVVETTGRTDILTILDADIARTADTFTVTIDTSVTATTGTYFWALRDITSGETVIASGKLDVTYAARSI